MMNRSLNSWLRFVCLLLVAFSLVPLLLFKTEAYNEEDDCRVIVSMGDSYSSGEGMHDYYGWELPEEQRKTDQDFLSHRSKNAWPARIKANANSEKTMADYWDENWFFVAMSGAVTKNIVGDSTETSNEYRLKHYYRTYDSYKEGKYSVTACTPIDHQIEIFDNPKLEGKEIDYVTMTIGGNDVDFAGIIMTLLHPSCIAPNVINNKIKTTMDNLDNVMMDIKNVYEKVSEKAGEKAHIIIMGYPHLLEPNGKGSLISENEATKVNWGIDVFNGRIEELVSECSNEFNISFVSAKAFDDHGAYSDDPWIYNYEWLIKYDDISDVENASAASFHPNEKGTAKYAELVNAEIERIESEKGNKPESTPKPEITPQPEKEETKKLLAAEKFYNAEGELEKVKRYTYNSLGLVEKEENWFKSVLGDWICKDSITYEYDELGNLLTCRYSGGEKKTYEYDNQGNLIKYNYWEGSKVESSIEYEYNTAGNCIKETHYDENGVKKYHSEFVYDANGNCLQEASYGADGDINYLFEYTYDSQGRLKVSVDKVNYSGTLEVFERWERTYDEKGNLVLSWCSDDAKNTYRYDSAGNLIEEDQVYGDGHYIYTYAYDQNNRIIEEAEKDCGWGDIDKYTYEYDSDGNMIWKRYTKQDKDGNTTASSATEYEYSLPEDKTESVDGITFEEARKIAREHWNLSDGDNYTEEGYLITVYGTEDLVTGVDGEKYYHFRYRALIVDHWSTWDEVYIHFKTGESFSVLPDPQTSAPGEDNTDIYKSVLTQYAEKEDVQYALYDIDKDGTEELIVMEPYNGHHIYTNKNSKSQLCGSISWGYLNGLYETNGEGLVEHYKGMFNGEFRESVSLSVLEDGELTAKETIISSEEHSYEEVQNALKAYTPIEFTSVEEGLLAG